MEVKDRKTLKEILASLRRIEQHLKVPPPSPECDHPECSNPATMTITSGHPPVTRRWCSVHTPGMRSVTEGLTVH